MVVNHVNDFRLLRILQRATLQTVETTTNVQVDRTQTGSHENTHNKANRCFSRRVTNELSDGRSMSRLRKWITVFCFLSIGLVIE